MKRCIASSLIIATLILLGFVGMWHINQTTEIMTQIIVEEEAALDQNDMEKAEKLNQQLSDFWNKQHSILTLYIRHNDIDEISKYISELDQLILHQNTSECSSRLSLIKMMIEHIRDTEIPNPTNVF